MSDTQQVAAGEINLEEVSSSGKPFLKNGSYSIRCISAEKKTSRKNNPMIEYKWEIVAPETVVGADGKEVKITGLQCMNWILLNDMGFPRLKALHKAAALPMSINPTSPNVRQYIGKAVKATLTTDVVPTKDDNTGEVMLDEKGQPITINQYNIVRFNSPDPDHTMLADNVAF